MAIVVQIAGGLELAVVAFARGGAARSTDPYAGSSLVYAAIALGVIVVTIVVTLVNALLLRASFFLCTKICGHSPSEPSEVSYAKAMLIAFVLQVINLGVQYVTDLFIEASTVGIGALGSAQATSDLKNALSFRLGSIGVSFLLNSALLGVMLASSYRRALLVTFLWWLLSFVLGLLIGVIVVLVALALGLMK